MDSETPPLLSTAGSTRAAGAGTSTTRRMAVATAAVAVVATVLLVIFAALYAKQKNDASELRRQVAAYEAMCGPDGCAPPSVVPHNASAACRVPLPADLPTPAAIASEVRAAWAASTVRNAAIAAGSDLAAADRAATVAAIPSWLNSSTIVVMRGGASSLMGFSDTDEAFVQESSFYYLTGLNVPDLALIAVPAAGALDYTLVVPHHDEQYAVWNGYVLDLDQWAAFSGFDHVIYDTQLEARLANLTAPNGPASIVYTLPGTTPPLPVPVGVYVDQDKDRLLAALNTARGSKTPGELAALRRASQVSAEAHAVLMAGIQPGWYEYDAEAVFRLTNALCGNFDMSYLPIVGAGVNGAILHYSDNTARTTASDILLIDAAANALRYTSDITRTYPVDGTYSPHQAAIYNIVLAAHDAAVGVLAVGASYAAADAVATRHLVEGLINEGILVGDLDQVLASNVIKKFYPHGLGHAVGLDVHDPSVSTFPPNFVGTIEPGIYFNDALLGPALANPALAPFINATAVNAYLAASFGGVRIEDVYIIHPNSDVENLSTAAPRTIAAVEALMATDDWFPV
ncbi:xaa-Pro dipeptidase [Thecamonas trahens ATCC 50062]|uniref:Xaa-Pro dipeptidase n=1 Tax=Thecamonas trahens ATCC 50062 TaxID=461836 RepID=A0A0L0DHS6_THETB|nr:xaa-Pro dipeptidase [Thecamonas trahens ATCC 50062]KNC51924.1 xaa-Pro dipeptidase [Thecamonas trahens ATCC 50062]|eukprot:XP_013755520.1 xaa-Pro dipeptidase [Thecamonas trahens ATCC 50062]